MMPSHLLSLALTCEYFGSALCVLFVDSKWGNSSSSSMSMMTSFLHYTERIILVPDKGGSTESCKHRFPIPIPLPEASLFDFPLKLIGSFPHLSI